MTPENFANAVSHLQERGVIKNGHGWKTDLATKLGVSRQTIDDFTKNGTRQAQTDLAIRALVAGIGPAETG